MPDRPDDIPVPPAGPDVFGAAVRTSGDVPTQADVLGRFHPAVQSWFTEQFSGATEVQLRGWDAISGGGNVVLSAPTGSGKTLAAFLWGLSQLVSAPAPEEMDRLRLVYISPLRALNYDVERNLRAPLAGIARHAALLGIPIPDLRVGVRTGDTPQRDRQRMLRHPPDILITTPESLYVMLTSRARDLYASVDTMIVDEIHALAQSKRGTHMALSMERLQEHIEGRPLQRIGLSATQKPIERIARFISGSDRPVTIVEAKQDKRYDIQVNVPVDDMTAVGLPVATTLQDLETPTSNADSYSIWGPLHEELLDLVESHRSTIIFTNSRRLAERTALALNELSERRRASVEVTEATDAMDELLAELPSAEEPDEPIEVSEGPVDEPLRSETPSGQLDLGPELDADEGGELPDAALGLVARAHHGSISRHTRKDIEESLKAGTLPAIVATSSLELGIDMGAVDLVVHIEAPKSVASGIQRIGRAGHGVGDVSVGRIFPKHRSHLLEAAAVARSVVHGEIEPVHIPELALDVLAQQLVAMGVDRDLAVTDAYELVVGAMPYADLSREQFENTLALLAGAFPGDDLADLRPRVVWDREADTYRTRSDAARIAITNAGTIPDRGLYGVFLAGGGARVGELDEEMVHETRLGDIIVLGATSWRVEEISRDRVLVTPVPGMVGKPPFWHGEGAGRSVDLGRSVGRLSREIAQLVDLRANVVTHDDAPALATRLDQVDADTDADENGLDAPLTSADTPSLADLEAALSLTSDAPDAPYGTELEVDGNDARDLESEVAAFAPALEHLQTEYFLDRRAANNLVALLRDQAEITGELPTDQTVVVERFRDELGDWRICILSPFGKAVHGPWAMAIESQLADRHDIESSALWSDDGIALRIPDMGSGEQLPTEALLIDPEAVEDLVVGQLAASSLFAGRFREIATRALLLPLARFDRRSPLWLQRIKAHDMLRIAQRHGSFPMILETYRECLRDVFDLPALRELLRGVTTGQVRVVDVETRSASPYAASLLFDYTANLLYDDDRPAAERRAQALSLDQSLLRELLGTDELRDLLDAEAIEEVEAELQRTDPMRRVGGGADGLHDLLRELGDLTFAEIAVRTKLTGEDAADTDALLIAVGQLERERRIVRIRLGGDERFVSIEDAAAYRDAFGIQLPLGLPEILIQSTDGSLARIVARASRTRSPFTTDVLAGRWGVAPSQLDPMLGALEEVGDLLRGGFVPAGTAQEWCHPDVLRRLRKRTLARLRREIEPIDQSALARFVLSWQHLTSPPPGSAGAVADALLQLEGVEASADTWENDLLGPRVSRYRTEWLDELIRTGQVVWVGHGFKHSKLQIQLLLREHVALIAPPPEDLPTPDDDPQLHQVMELLTSSGASFVSDIVIGTGLMQDQTLAALWRLAALGRATNDAWASLASAGSSMVKKASGSAALQVQATMRTRRSMRRSGAARLGRPGGASGGRNGAQDVRLQGRWSLVTPIRASLAERSAAQSDALLDCYGVVTRSVANARQLMPGGFASVYSELSGQEELGAVRRGYFVDGLGGAQFALPEAVDRLRALREPESSGGILITLRANDPAQPWGALLPWPELPNGVTAPQRTATGYVILRDGLPIASVSVSGKSLQLLVPDALGDVVRALAQLVRRRRVERLAIERVDGEPLGPEAMLAFAGSGFVRTPQGVRATPSTIAPARMTGGPTGGGGNGNGGRNRDGSPDIALPTHGRNKYRGGA